jgi:CRISPR/Cas system-associated exonuclease Cas4 (RecB family)
MLPDLPHPSPEPIARVTPTLSNDLLACPRRVGFARDPSFARWRRPSTFSVLGDAAHAVAEHVAEVQQWPAEPGELRRHLNAAWEERIEAGAARLAAAWAPAVPPPPEEWPAYQVTRLRTIRRAERAIGAQLEEPRSVAVACPSVPSSAAGTEVELVDRASGLEGRADRIERIDGSYRVVDLKTGMNQEEPEEEQLRQLLLYAVLVHRRTGEWPADIAVENASGEQFVVPLEPADAEAALSEVSVAVAAFNEQVQSAGELEARASVDTCRWCAYRTCCGAYWRKLSAEWGHAAAMGSVVHAGADGKGAHADVRVIAPEDLGSETTHIMGLAAVPPPTATWLAAVDLRPIRDPQSMVARWSSRIDVW